MTADLETRRQLVHIGACGFALLLPFLTWWQAALMALCALFFNLLALPRLGGRALYRAADTIRGYPAGIVFYPASVLVLTIVFPHRPDLVAAAWGILAFGDGCATLAGRRYGTRRLPWNGAKTWAGTCAFVAAGAAGGIALALWARQAVVDPPTVQATVAATVAATLAAAAVESTPSGIDDNIAVPAVAALVLWGFTFVEPARGGATALLAMPLIVEGAALNAAVAWLGWRTGSVSPSGTAAGILIGLVIFVGAGRAGWALLLVAFAVAVIASRCGLQRKTLLGIAQESGGRRGAGNAIANCGIAAFAAGVALATSHRDAALLVVVSALTAGASDTAASEIGKAWGRHTFLPTGLRRVPPGTSGAVSLEGTAAGLVSAAGLAAFAAYAGLIQPALIWVVAAAASIGSVAESLLGATLEPLGILNNDELNFLNTAIAAGAALLLLRGT